MVKFPEKMPDALARLLVVFVVLTAVLGAAWMLIPRGMKDVKVQWAEAIAREKARPPQYAGFRACEEVDRQSCRARSVTLPALP